MNAPAGPVIRHSTCPHDCPSVCALDVEIVGKDRIGRVRGNASQSYTAGVVCAKVARYAARIHHPERLLYPLRRSGPKGSGQFERISWDEALDTIAARFQSAEAQHGPETVWPYYYAGTMGRVQRDGIHRLTHAKRYSRFFSTICVNLAWPGYIVGTGRLAGPDPREMAKSDCVVIWGTNPVSTQVNVMTHAMRARKERAAKIVVIDVYRSPTMEQADLPLILRPGTDGALACAAMHVLFREGLADRAFMARFTDAPDELEAHLQSRTPAWAAAITGLSVDEIEAFARLVGQRKRTFFRLGYGFSRQRNGAANMHAASCIAAVTGAWELEGGGAFHNNGAIYHLDQTLIEGKDVIDPSIRILDQSRIGAILTGDAQALGGGPPVTAMLIQNTNPANVAPNQRLVAKGFGREDLFTVVHEQFMTDTARVADIVLPATMFLEHDDFYLGGGHQYMGYGPKLIEPPDECRSNRFVHRQLARRLGVSDRVFEMSDNDLIDETLRMSGWPGLEWLKSATWQDCQPPFEAAHYRDGFAWPDGKFRFRAKWMETPFGNIGPMGPWRTMPTLPDHWAVTEEVDAIHPFRLATSPARNFLNSSFTETAESRSREGRPTVMLHPEDAAELGVGEGDVVTLGNGRGSVRIHVKLFDGVKRKVCIAEGIWPNGAHLDGEGINVLTGDDATAPFGGAAFHDNRVWVRG